MRRAFLVLLALAAASAARPAETAPAGRSVPGLYVDRLPGSLAGTWEFALDDTPLGPEGLAGLTWRPLEVPGSWQAQGVSGHGTAWYRVRFELDPGLSGPPLAFVCRQIRDADEVYLDGQLVGRTGSLPPAYDKGTLVWRVYELPATLTARPGPHTLAVRVHNPGPRAGGILGEPTLDTVSAAFLKRMRAEAPRALLGAAFASLGLFSLFLFVRDREQRDFLFFFLATSATAVYVSTWLSVWTSSSVPLSTLFRGNLAATFLIPGLFLLFFLAFFDRATLSRHRAFLVLSGAGSLVCLLWPRVDDLYYVLAAGYVVTGAIAVDVLVLLWGDARRRAPYARWLFAGTAAVVLAVAHDVAQDYGALGDPVGAVRLFGPVFFVFMASFLAAMADRFAHLRMAASTDPLTGLANRAVLFDRIALEIARARRSGHPVALSILDLDHFKRFNDRFGHVAGDRLLAAAARALQASVRDTDLAARFGGEEFAVLLPEADAERALTCLERVRDAVAGLRVSGAAEGTTVSIGLAVFDPLERATISPTAWLRQADAALYTAKARGRNQVVTAVGEPPRSSASGVPMVGPRRRRPSSTGTAAVPPGGPPE